MSPPVLEFASAKPSADLLAVPPIAELLRLFVGKGDGWADPAGGQSSPAQHRHHGESTDFLDGFAVESLQGVILDQTSNTADSWKVKDTAAKKIMPGGLAICCGRNSNGMGADRGFELIHVLDVCHGGDQADTIVTVEIKVPYQAADDFTADDLAAPRSLGQRCRRSGSAAPDRGDPRRRVETMGLSGNSQARPLRLQDVVKATGRSACTIRRAIKDGTLQAHTVGRGKKRPTYEIHEADLKRYIEASRVESPDSPSIPKITVRRKSRHFD